MDKCLICKKLFLSHSKKVKCCLCLGRYHLNCISLSSDIINYIQDNEQTWYCSLCITEIFPFNNIEDDIEFVSTIEATTLPGNSLCYLSEKVFIPFELNDKDHSSLLCDPDPDLHYFNSFNQVRQIAITTQKPLFKSMLPNVLMLNVCFQCVIWTSEA